MRYSRSLIFLLGALLSVPTTTLAQAKTAVFAGTVVLRDGSAPVAGVRVVFLGEGRAVETDSTGRFRLPALPAGINRFLVIPPNAPRATVVLAFAAGETIERTLEVEPAAAPSTVAAAPAGQPTAPASAGPDSARPAPRRPSTNAADGQPLATVAVTASPPMDRRYMDFERRLKTGRGQYITAKQIDEAGYYSLQDAMRNLRGVKVDCGGGAGCFITMARATMGCTPEYIVDGFADNWFGAQTPIKDIQGIEVYTGASDVPGEFAGSNAACGLVVIWTKSGPPRRRPK
ncbi:MAG: TonB-dependent receptor plug domain-containing protein [Gemmatimonadaceae bacterium]|nr:TonB-dependent receptor plug domain-containing protein [Gemmatimonadaceae bacterium]